MTCTTLRAPLGPHNIELRRLRPELRDDPPGDPGPIFEDSAGVPFEDPERVVFADEEGWAHRRYRFDVVVDGIPALFGVSYRADIDADDPPDPVRMAEVVLDDVVSVQGVRHWEDFADKFDLVNELEPTYGLRRAKRAAKRRFRYFKRRERLLTERLGADALDELLMSWSAAAI